MRAVEQYRIPEADEVVGSRGRKTRAAMKIDLLMRRELVSRPKMQDMHRTAALWEISHVFYKRIPGTRQLPVEKKGGLSGRVS